MNNVRDRGRRAARSRGVGIRNQEFVLDQQAAVVQLLFDDAGENAGPLAPRQVGRLLVRRQRAPYEAAVSYRASSPGSDHAGNTDPAANTQASGIDRLSREEPPMLLTVPQVEAALQLGRTRTYELLRSGRLPVLRFGRVIRVPRAALEVWVAENSSGGSG